MLEGLGPSVLVFLALAGLAAGSIDAVVGGGGLIQLPALLVGLPGATPVQLLATNKVESIFGTTVRSITYFRRIRPDIRTAIPLAVAAFIGSLGGAAMAFLTSKEAVNPIDGALGPGTGSFFVVLVVAFILKIGYDTGMQFLG